MLALGVWLMAFQPSAWRQSPTLCAVISLLFSALSLASQMPQTIGLSMHLLDAFQLSAKSLRRLDHRLAVHTLRFHLCREMIANVYFHRFSQWHLGFTKPTAISWRWDLFLISIVSLEFGNWVPPVLSLSGHPGHLFPFLGAFAHWCLSGRWPSKRRDSCANLSRFVHWSCRQSLLLNNFDVLGSKSKFEMSIHQRFADAIWKISSCEISGRLRRQNLFGTHSNFLTRLK